MVTSVTSLGRNGLYDWLIQRVSAVIIGVYLWGVTTDYLTGMTLGKAATGVRLIAQVAIALALVVYLLWGLVLIWGGA